MRWLDRHAGAPSVLDGAAPAARRVAWLTGQSSWAHSELSAGQHAVLDALAADGWDPVRLGLPWTTSARAAGSTAPRSGLLAASARNTAQHLAARPGGRFARQVAGHLQPLLDTTTQRLLLLCGSTGAQVAGAVAPLVRVPDGVVVHVVALGPVGRLPEPGPAWQVHVVRGTGDRISRWGYRGPVDVHVPGAHLDAATGPAARDAVRRLASDSVPDAAPAPGAGAVDHGVRRPDVGVRP